VIFEMARNTGVALGAWVAPLVLAGCASTAIAPTSHNIEVPKDWTRRALPGTYQPADYEIFQLPALGTLVEAALAENRDLAQQASRLEAARHSIVVTRAARFPALTLSVGGDRSRAARTALIVDRVDASIGFGLELDAWGRLRDADRETVLRFKAEQARFADVERRVVADVVNAAFDVMAAKQLLGLLEQRLTNLSESLDVIEQSYRQGLREALDVYLAQTTLEQERANVASQTQAAYQAAAELELLIADYPDGEIALEGDLPEIDALIAAGTPAGVLTRRPDLQLAWFELLAADAALAVAHKNRFPSFDVSGGVQDSAGQLKQLVDNGNFAWSLTASIVQPLFQGGRLRALAEQARQRVFEAEARYLDAVFRALAEVENEITRSRTLEDRYEAFENARTNAEAALTIASDQYERGLVDYTAVLESQRRAFDAQTTVVQLRAQLLQSRVALELALGGDLRERVN
jgi:NodT family efflux transporter outer membrane factor (OMF) lipoprotein